jgi:hypothetical protein
MKPGLAFALLSLSLVLLTVKTTVAETEENFQPLFDGRTFAGWAVGEKTPQSWKIENGLLILTGGRAHLFTEASYTDFVVRFEWRPLKPRYNSGFFIRGRNQIQMAQGGAGKLFKDDRTKAAPKLHRPPGEWNEWEVTCDGPKVSIKINGQLVWEIDDFKATGGPLGFEAEGHAIEFRNLRIRELHREK